MCNTCLTFGSIPPRNSEKIAEKKMKNKSCCCYCSGAYTSVVAILIAVMAYAFAGVVVRTRLNWRIKNEDGNRKYKRKGIVKGLLDKIPYI